MSRRPRFIAAALALVVATTGCTTLPIMDKRAVSNARVDTVADGDTFTIRDSAGFPTVVRLLGIDAPELAHDGRSAECGAEAAREALSQLVQGRRVDLYTDVGSDRTDRYGRLLAYVEESAAGDIAEQLLRHGLVVAWYPANAGRPSRATAYDNAQNTAETGHIGSWGACPDMRG